MVWVGVGNFFKGYMKLGYLVIFGTALDTNPLCKSVAYFGLSRLVSLGPVSFPSSV